MGVARVNTVWVLSLSECKSVDTGGGGADRDGGVRVAAEARDELVGGDWDDGGGARVGRDVHSLPGRRGEEREERD